MFYLQKKWRKNFLVVLDNKCITKYATYENEDGGLMETKQNDFHSFDAEHTNVCRSSNTRLFFI